MFRPGRLVRTLASTALSKPKQQSVQNSVNFKRDIFSFAFSDSTPSMGSVRLMSSVAKPAIKSFSQLPEDQKKMVEEIVNEFEAKPNQAPKESTALKTLIEKYNIEDRSNILFAARKIIEKNEREKETFVLPNLPPGMNLQHYENHGPGAYLDRGFKR